MSFTHAFLEDGTPISGAIVGPSGPSTFDGVSAQQPTTNTTHSHAKHLSFYGLERCFSRC